MQSSNETKEKIDQEIDKQVEELKKMIEERYKDATMDEMELAVFKHLQGIGKTVLEGYIEKKTLNSKEWKRLKSKGKDINEI